MYSLFALSGVSEWAEMNEWMMEYIIKGCRYSAKWERVSIRGASVTTRKARMNKCQCGDRT